MSESETTASDVADDHPAGRTAGGDAVRTPGSVDRSAESPRRPRPSAEAIDLLEVAGPSIAKRLVPLLAAVGVLWLLRRLFRRARD
jgi:hypothetical protein